MTFYSEQMKIKSKQGLKKAILLRLNQLGYLMDPDRILASQVSKGDVLIFFTSDFDRKIHTTRIETPGYWYIDEDDIENACKDITQCLNS